MFHASKSHVPSIMSQLQRASGVVLIGTVALLTVSPAFAGPRVYSDTREFGPYELDSKSLQQMPAGMVPIGFEKDVWVLGYTSAIVDMEGEELQNEFQCHTMLALPLEEQWQNSPLNAKPFAGLYSDGYTRQLILPQGFGLHIKKDDALELMPMFNNRTDEVIPAGMQVTVHFAVAEELEEQLTPLFTTVVAVSDPHLYMVPPGEDTRERRFSFDYDGIIHAMGVHIHPYGRWIEIVNDSTNETVWRSVGKVGADGQLTDMPFYSSQEGYRFSRNDRFTIRARYSNPTDIEQDAMAGLFIFFSTDDGKMPHPSAGSLGATQSSSELSSQSSSR